MTVKEFATKFRTLVGDTNADIPASFIIECINWAFRALPNVPKLHAFTKHYTVQLDADHHFRWNLIGDFRSLEDIAHLNFYSTKGGDPCLLPLCAKDTDIFYAKNGLVEMKKAGTPCEYTLEREGDDWWLVLDRPSNIPIVIDYIAYGYPYPVSSLDDEIELSAVIENIVLMTMRDLFYQEAEDLAFAGATLDTLSNKYIQEAIQILNKRTSNRPNAILGEVGS